MRQLLTLLLLIPLALMVLAVVGVLAPALRWGFRLGFAAVAALLAVLLLPPHLGHGWAPLAVFAGVLLLLSARGPRRRRPARASERVVDQEPARGPSASAPDPGPAWRDLRDLADWRSRRRLAAAWDACARYLTVADAQEDASAQLPIKIRKHLPVQIADCVRHARTASPDERRTLLADTLASLETVAARAEERRRELAYQAQGEFRARQAHLNRPED